MSEFVLFSFAVPPQFLKFPCRLTPLVRGKIIADDLAVLHHEAHTFEFGDVSDGVAAHGDEIGEFPRFDGADTVLPPQHFRGVDGYCANRVKRRKSCTTQVDKCSHAGLSTRLS